MEHLEKLRLKCEETLSLFKKKRLADFVYTGSSNYDEHISRLLSLTARIDDRLEQFQSENDTKLVDNLIVEYDNLENDANTKLIESLRIELDNVDKEMWYDSHFNNWKFMPKRQECAEYDTLDKLRYSVYRCMMFDHLEKTWKRTMFPNIGDRLEFF